MIKRVEALQKFLKAVERLAKNNDITIDDAYRFAKQQFGEVSDLMKLQINRLFKKKQDPGIRKPRKEGEVIEASFKPGRDKKGNIVEESPSQKAKREEIMATDKTDEFNLSKDDPFGDLEKIVKGEGDTGLPKNPFRRGGGLDLTTGMTRTAARVVLDRYGIKVPDRADAIDVFEENFGGDALMDLKDVADELIEKEQMGRITESMGEFLESRGMFDLKVDKTARKGMSNKELLEKMEEVEAEDILKKFDPEDREPNSKGGINRVGFAKGKIKLVQFLAGKGLDLVKEVRKSVDDIFETGDTKYDADVVVEDMVERLGIDRDVVDQRDLLDAYDEAYKMLVSDKRKDPFTDIGLKKLEKALGEEGVDPKETILPSKEFSVEEGLDDLDNLNLGSKKGDVVSKQLKIMRLAEDIQPGLFEKLTDKQLDIIVKYGDRIDQDLLKNIVLDPDPSNQAAAIATLDEVETIMGKGMSQDEIMSVLQSTPRRKQAEGGLSYLMGM